MKFTETKTDVELEKIRKNYVLTISEAVCQAYEINQQINIFFDPESLTFTHSSADRMDGWVQVDSIDKSNFPGELDEIKNLEFSDWLRIVDTSDLDDKIDDMVGA